MYVLTSLSIYMHKHTYDLIIYTLYINVVGYVVTVRTLTVSVLDRLGPHRLETAPESTGLGLVLSGAVH